MSLDVVILEIVQKSHKNDGLKHDNYSTARGFPSFSRTVVRRPFGDSSRGLR
jgi:hypothetical protein